MVDTLNNDIKRLIEIELKYNNATDFDYKRQMYNVAYIGLYRLNKIYDLQNNAEILDFIKSSELYNKLYIKNYIPHCNKSNTGNDERVVSKNDRALLSRLELIENQISEIRLMIINKS